MRRRTATTLTALAAMAALIGALAPSAQGRTPEAACTPDIPVSTEAGADRLLSLVEGLESTGHTPAEVDAVLAERACLTRVSEPIPPAEGLTVTAPDVYVIAEVNGVDRWVAITDWEFADLPAAPMSGDQAVVTWFDAPVEPIVRVVHYAGTTPQYPSVSREDAAELGPYGVGFLLPPQKSATDMNIATGRSALVFEGTGACRTLTACGAFAHTWNATAVTGIDLAATGMTLYWSSTADRALTLSSPTSVPGVCG
ncbi:hypothetical protein [Streptomyces sp. PT12]|uniref:hypothetical protein n=1 Tax=Streptomyces sp. PT12 TaxID=1510197 RepID=UPI0011BFADA2|nr:hypothetical protein [Streptomyces sp. PT12]